MKTISIIIPVYNEKQFIARTIEKVIHADTFTLEKEIIVVDNASHDTTPDDYPTV